MKIKLAIAASTIGIMTLFGGTAMAAGTDSLSLGGGSFQTGSSFAVPVYVNTGTDPVNVVEAAFSYNTSAMQFESASCSSAFSVTANATANDLTCGVAGGASVTGSQQVGTLMFKALSSGGTTASIAAGSHVYRSTDSTDVWNGVTTSTNFTFTTPAPTPAPTKPKTATTTSTPTTVATTTQTATTSTTTPTTAPASTQPKTTPTHSVIETKDAAAVAVQHPSDSWIWALVAIATAALLFLMPTAWMQRHPKQSKTYKHSTKRAVKANATDPTKHLHRRGA